MKTRILICRHGNTFDKGDLVTRVGSRTDLQLSSSGIEQSKLLSKELSPFKSGFNFKLAFCSSLLRTKETGMYILSQGHKAKTLTILPFLKEIDYGPDENKSEQEVVNRIGRNALDLWDKKALPPNGWILNPHKIIQSWKLFFNDTSNDGGDILVVTSNGIARFIYEAVHMVETDVVRKLNTASFGVVEIKNNISTLKSWNINKLSK